MKIARLVLPVVLVAVLVGCAAPEEDEPAPTVTVTETATPSPSPSATPTQSTAPSTPPPAEVAPPSSAVDVTAEAQAAAGAGVTRAEQTEPGRYVVWTSIVDPRGEDGSPEAQAAIGICNAVQQHFGATSVSVYEADETSFILYGHPVYGASSCVEV